MEAESQELAKAQFGNHENSQNYCKKTVLSPKKGGQISTDKFAPKHDN
jgi:hypothetical protein